MTRIGMSAPYWLDPNDKISFPDVSEALLEPDGLLAIGGDLSTERLLVAYRHGIFPWYSDGQPILWWSPNPRAVLFPSELIISRSLRKSLKREDYTVKVDTAFERVIQACAKPRKDGLGTWITDDMMRAYIRLYKQGHAHCVEVWRNNALVGGLYGIGMGKVFFGESMFSTQTDASKIAFAYLTRQIQRWNFALIDCQVYSDHIGSLGARVIPREDFIALLVKYCDLPSKTENWRFDIILKDVISET